MKGSASAVNCRCHEPFAVCPVARGMRQRLMRLTLLTILATLAAACSSAPSVAQDMPFSSYLQVLIARARAEGVSEATIQRMTYDLTPNQRVIDLDRAQPGTPSSSGSIPTFSAYGIRANASALADGSPPAMSGQPPGVWLCAKCAQARPSRQLV